MRDATGEPDTGAETPLAVCEIKSTDGLLLYTQDRENSEAWLIAPATEVCQ
jgi:hypothetical protein